MSNDKRICAFYSQGPHFGRMLEALRERFPDASIDAWVPDSVDCPEEWQCMTESLTTVSVNSFSELLSLIWQLRRCKYDVVAIMFPSFKLRLLTCLSGARSCVCCSLSGELVSLGTSLVVAVVREVLKRVRGLARYVTIWLVTRFVRVNL